MYVEYKEGTKHAGTNADISETMDSFKDCGLLLTDDDIVVDIDHLSKDVIKDLIKDFGIKTRVVWTDRGAHLWFKKPPWFTKRKDGVCRLGFEIEMKNKQSSPNGITVKRNGVPRQIDNPDVQQFLPAIFKVDPKVKYEDLTNLDEGDGRNKKLFAHRRMLDKMNAPDVDRIIAFINYHVFQTPLESSELENILRDMPRPEDGMDERAIIADMVINECRAVNFSGTIWWFRNNQYVSDTNNVRLIRRIYTQCEGKPTSFVDEVIKQIAYRSEYIPDETVFPIRFKNGILRKGKFIQMKDYLQFTPYFIDVQYDPETQPVQIVDDYINNLTGGDESYRSLLLEIIGYVMITDPERIRSLGKFFMFRGDGANGKGTLLQIMKKVYGANNCTNLSIKQMVDDRFKVTMLGKLANLGDDIEAEAINNDQLKVLKNISTADTVSTRRLYSESQSATFTVKLYFTTNSDIRSFEKGYAYKRRIVWLPMFNKVETPDPEFISKITTDEALRYWIRLIVEGYMRLYENRRWTECKVVKDYNDQYHEDNNPCLLFAKDLDPKTEIIGKTVREIEQAFHDWDTDNSKFSSKLFKAAVWDLYRIGLGRGKVVGKTRRMFMYQDDTTQVLDH